MKIDMEKEEMAAQLRGSLQSFIKVFTKYMTQRAYIESQPEGRESHQITICRELTSFMRMEHPNENLLINVEPGSGKSLHLCMFVAWCYTHYADCNFIYISYSHTLSAAKTLFIKQIIGSELFKYLFNVEISRDSRAKDHFATTAGGEVAAFGSAGAITGRDAGLPGLPRFSGAVIIDDAHKPDEAHSDTVRQSVIRNYEETIRQRPRGNNVPIIFIGQRVHEADLAAYFIEDKDVKPWRKIILPSIDAAGNALCPERNSKEYLEELAEKSPYVYASQYQQDPLPAGGGIWKRDWMVELDEYPKITTTFITADTAETAKSYNDATVFSFWGVYEIESFGRNTGLTGLHWIDCLETRIEPKDLKDTFLDFWQECTRFKIPPHIAAIEKKSTGVTLVSALEEVRGISVKDIKRTRASGSKTERFLRAQPYLANKQISINADAKHKKLVLDHIEKITANDTHRFDDIADTLADAVDISLIEKQIIAVDNSTNTDDQKMAALRKGMLKRVNARSKNYGGYR
jgi:predicted phage terminase large subunit-like protein